MEQVLRLNSTDQRITYDVGWKLVSNTTEGPNGTYLLATAEADLFFLFRGTVSLTPNGNPRRFLLIFVIL